MALLGADMYLNELTNYYVGLTGVVDLTASVNLLTYTDDNVSADATPGLVSELDGVTDED